MRWKWSSLLSESDGPAQGGGDERDTDIINLEGTQAGSVDRDVTCADPREGQVSWSHLSHLSHHGDLFHCLTTTAAVLLFPSATLS